MGALRGRSPTRAGGGEGGELTLTRAGGGVASAVAFLLSQEAIFINGAILPVDGGRSAVDIPVVTKAAKKRF